MDASSEAEFSNLDLDIIRATPDGAGMGARVFEGASEHGQQLQSQRGGVFFRVSRLAVGVQR